MPVDPEALQALLATVRKRSSSGRWAQASAFAEGGAVLLQRDAGDEVVLVVQNEGWSSTAVLYPETGEWACDCGGADPCVHVAAGVIALDAARRSGAPLRALTQVRARLSHRLARTKSGLALARYVVAPDGTERRVEGSVVDLAGAGLVPEEPELALDRIVSARPLDALPLDRLTPLLAALAGCADVTLDGAPVAASTAPVLPRAVVEDHPRGFALRVERDPAVTEVLARGLALCGATLRPLGAMDLSGERLERLPRTRVFAAQDVADLVLAALPELAARVPVEVRARSLPPVARGVAPRVAMDFAVAGHALSVVPAVVYGDPPLARVVDGRCVHVAGPVPVRDPDAEVRLAHALRDELGLAVGRRSEFRGADAARFLARLRDRGAAGAAPSSLFAAGALVPRLEVRDEGFDLDFALTTDDGAPAAGRADAAEVVAAWREGLDVVPLAGGGFAPLPLAWLREHGHRVADLLAARGDDGAVPRAALPQLAALCDALEHPKPAGLAGLAALVEGFERVPPAALPPDLTATLRRYQRAGVDWLCFLRDARLGAVLADDMGLGKTLQAMCAFRGRALVVCPRSVLHNWADELRRFRPGLAVATYHGPARALDPRADVTLTTYAVLRLDAARLAGDAWDVVVLDEAQAIKNPDSQAARAAYGLRAGFRVALSGTPVENRLEELWSLVHFTNPGLLGGRSDFDERYASPIAGGDAEAMERLRRRVRPFLLRRLKRDVAPELPPRTDAVLRCELDEREREVYDAVRAAAQRDVVAALRAGGGTLAALEALLRLRQAACHPSLVPGQRAETSAKVECLLDALETAAADGHRALVFSQWTALLDLVEPRLREAGVGFTRLDGATRDRAGVVRAFQSEGGPPVMLVSLKAGGTGLNLTAADHVFLLDPWWNPATEDQAADRAHRIGQARSVMVYRLVAEDTVEERILALQARKRALADAALDGADPAAALTREDLLELLS